jgi:hypothetical protein
MQTSYILLMQRVCLYTYTIVIVKQIKYFKFGDNLRYAWKEQKGNTLIHDLLFTIHRVKTKIISQLIT